jgi:hypothetical protein
MFKGHMPDITPAQLVAAITWVAAQAVAAGWINNDQSQHWVQLSSTIVTAVWIAGDAILRGFRNVRKAAEANAARR